MMINARFIDKQISWASFKKEDNVVVLLSSAIQGRFMQVSGKETMSEGSAVSLMASGPKAELGESCVVTGLRATSALGWFCWYHEAGWYPQVPLSLHTDHVHTHSPLLIPYSSRWARNSTCKASINRSILTTGHPAHSLILNHTLLWGNFKLSEFNHFQGTSVQKKENVPMFRPLLEQLCYYGQ